MIVFKLNHKEEFKVFNLFYERKNIIIISQSSNKIHSTPKLNKNMCDVLLHTARDFIASCSRVNRMHILYIVLSCC